jgi:hypothetical protein
MGRGPGKYLQGYLQEYAHIWQAVLWLRQPVTSISPARLGSIQVQTMVDKVAPYRFFSKYFDCPLPFKRNPRYITFATDKTVKQTNSLSLALSLSHTHIHRHTHRQMPL